MPMIEVQMYPGRSEEQKASLADAALMANDTILRCSNHNFTFKLSDGKGVNSPSFRLRVFDVKVEDEIFYGRWLA